MNVARSSNTNNGRHLSSTTFVVLDLETTGASPNAGAGITEIGAVKVRGGEVIGIFETFINPRESIPPYITELTGITDDMVMYAPPIENALPTLLEFLGHEDESILVAHNAPFDLGFLKAASAMHNSLIHLSNQRTAHSMMPTPPLQFYMASLKDLEVLRLIRWKNSLNFLQIRRSACGRKYQKSSRKKSSYSVRPIAAPI
jgi:hypothetical protein